MTPERSNRVHGQPTRRRATPSIARNAVGLILFIVIGLGLFWGANAIAQPYWTDNQTTDKVQSLYDEPANTIEAIFLGSSTVTDGIVPMTLYDTHGICAYNLGTSAQPLLASYYWLEEAYRLHPETLRTVVLDCSSLRRDATFERYQMSTDDMQLPTKFEAVRAYSEGVTGALTYFLPLLAYHERWTELSGDDLAKFTYPNHRYLRGYEPSSQRYIENETLDLLVAPEYDVNEAAEPAAIPAEQREYFERIVAFCEEHDLNLVLMKIPQPTWTSAEHNATQALADEHGLEFLDFNFEPLRSEVGYDQALLTRDGMHLNDEGGRLMTEAIGAALLERGYVRDVRGDERYAFLDDQLADFQRVTDDLEAERASADPAQYASAAADASHTVFIAVNNASSALTDDQRAAFEALGLVELAALEPSENYIGVIEAGGVVAETTAPADEKTVFSNYAPSKAMLPRGDYFWFEDRAKADALESDAAAETSEVKPADAGVSIILYDDELKAVVDTAVFNGDGTLTRIVDLNGALDAALAAGTSSDRLPEVLSNLADYRALCATTMPGR